MNKQIILLYARKLVHVVSMKFTFPASNQRHSQSCCQCLLSPTPVLFELSSCLIVILGKIFVHKSLIYKHFEMVKIGAGTS